MAEERLREEEQEEEVRELAREAMALDVEGEVENLRRDVMGRGWSAVELDEVLGMIRAAVEEYERKREERAGGGGAQEEEEEEEEDEDGESWVSGDQISESRDGAPTQSVVSSLDGHTTAASKQQPQPSATTSTALPHRPRVRSWLGLGTEGQSGGASGHAPVSDDSTPADSFASDSGLDSEDYEQELRRRYRVTAGAVEPTPEAKDKAAALIQGEVRRLSFTTRPGARARGWVG